MSVWDFIRESYLGDYAMLARVSAWLWQNRIWCALVVLAIIFVGLILSMMKQQVPPSDELPHLSQDDIGKIEAFNNHGTRALPSISLAERQAEELIELCFAEHAHNERGEM